VTIAGIFLVAAPNQDRREAEETGILPNICYPAIPAQFQSRRLGFLQCVEYLPLYTRDLKDRTKPTVAVDSAGDSQPDMYIEPSPPVLARSDRGLPD
jgi:hypothetical protein